MALGLRPFIYINNNPQTVELQPAFEDASFKALDMSDDFEQLGNISRTRRVMGNRLTIRQEGRGSEPNGPT